MLAPSGGVRSERRSRTTCSMPAFCRQCEAVSPAMPAPTTMTRKGDSRLGIFLIWNDGRGGGVSHSKFVWRMLPSGRPYLGGVSPPNEISQPSATTGFTSVQGPSNAILNAVRLGPTQSSDCFVRILESLRAFSEPSVRAAQRTRSLLRPK